MSESSSEEKKSQALPTSPENIPATESTEKTNLRSKKFMFLKLGNSTFALPLSSVREVMGVGQISSLPNMPHYFAGLINLRGKIVSAVHLKKSLNFVTRTEDTDQGSKRPCVIITEFNGSMFGAIVDDVVEVQAISNREIDHAVDGLNNKDLFEGIIKREGADLAPILKLEKALQVVELIALSKKVAG